MGYGERAAVQSSNVRWERRAGAQRAEAGVGTPSGPVPTHSKAHLGGRLKVLVLMTLMQEGGRAQRHTSADVTDASARRPLAVTPMASRACCPSPPGSAVNVDGKILSGLSAKVTTLAD